jgi:hypothetical protein
MADHSGHRQPVGCTAALRGGLPSAAALPTRLRRVTGAAAGDRGEGDVNILAGRGVSDPGLGAGAGKSKAEWSARPFGFLNSNTQEIFGMRTKVIATISILVLACLACVGPNSPSVSPKTATVVPPVKPVVRPTLAPTSLPVITGRTIYVANTDGDGVVLRFAPRPDARTSIVFPEGQALTLLALTDEGWAHISAPAEGYIPPQYWSYSPPAMRDQPLPTPQSQPPPVLSGCPTGCTEHKPGCDIKGNISYTAGEKIYHVPGGKYYDATVIDPRYGERWFCTEDEAIANGWRRSKQ